MIKHAWLTPMYHPADPTQAVSVSQDSLTAVTVNLMGGESRCISLYFVEITQNGSSDSPVIMNSPSPSIGVTELDLCRNRYSFVGFVQAPSGVQGGRSTAQMIGKYLKPNLLGTTHHIIIASIYKFTCTNETQSNALGDSIKCCLRIYVNPVLLFDAFYCRFPHNYKQNKGKGRCMQFAIV